MWHRVLSVVYSMNLQPWIFTFRDTWIAKIRLFPQTFESKEESLLFDQLPYGVCHTQCYCTFYPERSLTPSLLLPGAKSLHCGIKQVNYCSGSSHYLLKPSGVRTRLQKDHFYTLVLYTNPFVWVTRLSLLQLLSEIEVCLVFKWAETFKK